jgi:hypothetical protein
MFSLTIGMGMLDTIVKGREESLESTRLASLKRCRSIDCEYNVVAFLRLRLSRYYI